MKTVAVTAGLGNPYAEYARRLADRINRLARCVDDGIECVLADLPWHQIKDSTMAGGWVWDAVPSDVERVMWLDCDIVVPTPLRLSELPDGSFCAVADVPDAVKPAMEKWSPLRQIHSYFNAGVYFATRETQIVFEMYKRIAAETSPQDRLYPDQDLLNFLIWQMFGDRADCPAGWTPVSQEWNMLVWRNMPERMRVVHYAGVPRRWRIMDALYNAMESDDGWMETDFDNDRALVWGRSHVVRNLYEAYHQ